MLKVVAVTAALAGIGGASAAQIQSALNERNQ